MTVAERDRQREADDGDPDATVHVRRTQGAGKRYHVDAECPTLSDVDAEDRQSLTRAQAKRRHHVPCARCVLEDTAPDGYAARETNTSPAVLLRTRDDVNTVEEVADAMADAAED